VVAQLLRIPRSAAGQAIDYVNEAIA